MFVASYRNTVASAKRVVVDEGIDLTIAARQARAERAKREVVERRQKAEAELRRLAQEQQVREARRRQLVARVEMALTEFKRDVPARDIIAATAIKHNMPTKVLTGKSRSKPIVAARYEAIRAVADARPDLSLPAIGRLFGGRDHTTILYALQKTAVPGRHHRLPLQHKGGEG